jgi:hypothetical protein
VLPTNSLNDLPPFLCLIQLAKAIDRLKIFSRRSASV